MGRTLASLAAVTCALAASLAAGAAAVCAQVPEAEARLLAPAVEAEPARTGHAAWYDSLAAMADSAEVARIARVRTAAAGGSADGHVAAGLAWLRLHELGGGEPALAGARRAFDRARDIDDRSAWAHFGTGWALANARDMRIPTPGGVLDGIATVQSVAEVVALDPDSRAARALRRALELDPAHEVAARTLAGLAIERRDRDMLDAAAAALQRAAAANDITRAGLVALARVEALRGWLAPAEAAARRALRRGPTAAALRALALALLPQDGHADEGAAAYFAGTRILDDRGAALYRDDVRTLLDDDEAAAWDALPPEARGAWLRTLWELRAALSARTTAERLAIHFERLEAAHARYARKQRRGARPADALVADSAVLALPFDDRGPIFVRHGAPDTIITSPIFRGVPPHNETWVYGDRRGRPELFYFHKTDDASDWVLTGPLQCDPLYFIYGEEGPGAINRIAMHRLARPSGPDPDLRRYMAYVEDRALYDKRLTTAAMRCMEISLALRATLDGLTGADPATVMRVLNESQREIEDVRRRDLELRADVRAAANRLLRTESAAPEFLRPLDVLATLYAFRGEGGLTDMLAAVLLPFDGFSTASADGATVYPVSLAVVLADTAAGRVARADTTRSFVTSDDAEPGRFFRTFLSLRVPPADSAAYRVVARNAAAADEGRVLAGRVAIPAFEPGRLQVSDLVVAESTDGRWRRGGAALAPIPTHQVDRDAAFRLFYEVYDLEAGSAYTTTIQVVPREAQGLLDRVRGLFGGRPDAIELRFEDVARDGPRPGVMAELRTITAALPEGIYRITVEVRDAAGARATRTAPLIVNPPAAAR